MGDDKTLIADLRHHADILDEEAGRREARNALLAQMHRVRAIRLRRAANRLEVLTATAINALPGLLDEVDRLREALKPFAGLTIGGKIADDPENREKYPLLTQQILNARAALQASEDKP